MDPIRENFQVAMSPSRMRSGKPNNRERAESAARRQTHRGGLPLGDLIAVCQRWHDYDAFVADMAPWPSPKHSLDRIDVNGGYCPNNCRWVLPLEQVLNLRSNRLIEIKGIRRSLSAWVRINRLPKSTMEAGLYRYGWEATAAVTTPVRSKRGKA